MMEGVPLSDFTLRKSTHATTKSPAWERIRARTRRPCCRRRSLGMSVMLTNKEAGSAKDSASLLSPAAWSESKAFRLPAKYPSARTKNTGSSALTSPLMFMRDSFLCSLEIDLSSESEDDRALRASSHVFVVLDDRLQEEHWQKIQQSVEINSLLGLPRSHAGRKKLWAQTVAHIAQRHGVVNVQGKRLVEAQSRGQQGVVAIDVWRTPVVRKSAIQTLSAFSVHPPKSLARHPIQEVISRSWCRTCRRRELSGIVGGAELIEARISLAALDVVKGPHGRCLIAWSESNFRNAHRNSVELRNQPRWVL